MPRRLSSKTGLRLVVSLLLLTAATGALTGGAAAGAGTLPVLALSVNASTVTATGTMQAGAVNVVSTITGAKEGTTILVELDPGTSPEAVYAFLKSKAAADPNKIEAYGSIVFDAEVTSSATSEIQTNLAPGVYVALAGKGEGPPALHTAFTVSPSAAPAVLPTPTATIRTIDFGFRGPTVLHRGELVRFRNEGLLVHMDIAARTRTHAGARRLVRALLAGREREIGKLVTGTPAAFAGPLSPGSYQQETITAKPGWYVQISFMNTEDGRDDAFLGMERIIKIVK